jgi:RimJ/RimL family protein N-acetyltransferase
MLNFRKLEKSDLCTLAPYFVGVSSHYCDLTMGNLFMWRNDLSTAFAFEGENLFIEKEFEAGHYAFLYPLGQDPEKGLDRLDDYCLAEKRPLAFYALSEEQALALGKRYPHHQITCLRSWSDYFYNLTDLRDFPGKRYESKRHNANRFLTQHPDVQFREAFAGDISKIEAFLQRYLEENKDRDISLEEMNLTHEMILNPACIHSRIGCFFLGEEVIGFALGEKKGDTIYLHIEKALREYPGIYQALTSAYLQNFGEDALYTNREEDDGNLGLREAKLQLHPLAVLPKFFFEVTNPLDLLKDIPSLSSERLRLEPLQKEDAGAYSSMALDGELNRYWGYDYHQDLTSGEAATPEFFYSDVHNDWLRRTCLSFALKDEANHFLGEAVLYGFGSLKEAELGIRLLPAFQKQGYGREALQTLLGFAQKIGLREIRYESYQENYPSLALAKDFGFQLFACDPQKDYFTLSLKNL